MKTVKQKADDVKKVARENGWRVRIKKEEGISLEFRRGKEVVTAVWREGRMRGRLSTYTCGSRHFILRNAASIKRQLAVSPEDAAKENAAVREYHAMTRKPKAVSVSEEDHVSDEERRAMLPFDPETATADEITKAVLGKVLVWRNREGGSYSSARVLDRPNQRFLRVRMTRLGEPYIEFCSVDGGFVSVSLSRLVEVR